jgi:hypothetical protein
MVEETSLWDVCWRCKLQVNGIMSSSCGCHSITDREFECIILFIHVAEETEFVYDCNIEYVAGDSHWFCINIFINPWTQLQLEVKQDEMEICLEK